MIGRMVSYAPELGSICLIIFLAGKSKYSSPSVMAFKFPSLKRKKGEHLSPVIKDLPSFDWSNLTDKEEIGRGSFGSVFVAKYGLTSENGGLVVIKKLLGTEEEDKRLFLKEAKILYGLQNKNVVQFKAICPKPTAIMLEYLCFDFALFGIQESVCSLDDFLTFIDARDAFEQFPFQNKIAQDVSSGITYLHDQGIAHRDLKPANVLVSNNHYAGLDNEIEQRNVFSSEPIICKVTDFGESRSRATQTATICHTATQNIQRGSPAYMAPEIFLENVISMAATMEHLKSIDVWAMGMIFFMLLNPDHKHPFETDLKMSNSRLPWREMIQSKFQKKEKPTHGTKYEKCQATDWFVVSEAYEKCTCFRPSERPPAAEIKELFREDNHVPTCKDIPLKVSQSSAVASYDHEVLSAGCELKEMAVIPNDGTNACVFLCLLISDRLYRDGERPLSEDCWRDTASLVEEIIVTSPSSFNRLRDLSKFYDVMEAYQLLRKDGLIAKYTISEEMVPRQRVYSQTGRAALMDAVTSLYKGDNKSRMALYTCGGYIVLVGCRSGELFVIDTHPTPVELGGDGNGLIKVFGPCADGNSAGGLCTWLWRRLNMSGVDEDQTQSFSILESDHR